MNKRVVLMVVAVAFFATTVSWGARLRPFLKVKGASDDNIYLDESGQIASAITTITPGLNLVLAMGAHNFTLSGFADIISYTVDPDKNKAQNTVLSFNTDSMGNKAKFRFGAISQNVSDPATSELTQRVQRQQDTVNINADIPIVSGLGVGLNYNYTNHAYSSATYNNFNRREDMMGVTLSYMLSKIAIVAGMNTGSVIYKTETNNNRIQQVEVGIERKMTARMKTMVKFGQETRNYDTLADPAALPIFILQVAERFSSTTFVKLIGEKRSYESSTYAENPTFDSTAITLGVEQNIGKKVTVSLDYVNMTNDYPNLVAALPELRKDALMNIKLGVDYRIQKWISCRAGWTNKSRDSNVNTEDYKNNVIEVGVNLSY